MNFAIDFAETDYRVPDSDTTKGVFAETVRCEKLAVALVG